MNNRNGLIFNIGVVVVIAYYHTVVRHAEAFPFLFRSDNAGRRQLVEWQQPIDEWNITSVPRSIIPFLKARNSSNYYLHPKTDENNSSDDEVLQRLREMKVNISLIYIGNLPAVAAAAATAMCNRVQLRYAKHICMHLFCHASQMITWPMCVCLCVNVNILIAFSQLS